MPDKYYFLARDVRDTLEQGCFYTMDELTDSTNEETADFLIQNNIAIEARYLPEGAKRPAAKEAPKKRGRTRKGSYKTRQMKAD